MYNYQWSGGFKPYNHQMQTSYFLYNNPKSFCLNDVGTGKTLSAYWTMDCIKKENRFFGKVIVLSPLSTLEIVHLKTLNEHFNHIDAVIVCGTATQREEILKEDHDVYIINHDAVRNLKDALISMQKIDMIIVDEISGFKSFKTKKYRALKDIIIKHRPKYIWGLTGSPTPTSPMDGWGIATIIGWPKMTFAEYRNKTMFKVVEKFWVPRSNVEQIVSGILQPAIRFDRGECIDLPDTVYEDRFAELTKEQSDKYYDYVHTTREILKDKPISLFQETTLTNKLLQICCGIMYKHDEDEEKEVEFYDCSPRIKCVKEIIEETRSKIIVYVPFTAALDRIAEELRKDYSVDVVDGRTKESERAIIFNRFQNENNPRVLVAHPKAISHGITLTRASVVVYYAPFYGVETFLQSSGRITRIGQTEKTCIIKIFGSWLEKEIYRRLENKIDLQGALLEQCKRDNGGYGYEEGQT